MTGQGVMVVCCVIIFIIIIRQHIKMRKLVNVEPTSAPNPVILAVKSAKKILAVTLSHVVQGVVLLLSNYLATTEDSIFFARWLGFSQSIWNCCFYIAFSPDTRKEIKRLFCKQSQAHDGTSTQQI